MAKRKGGSLVAQAKKKHRTHTYGTYIHIHMLGKAVGKLLLGPTLRKRAALLPKESDVWLFIVMFLLFLLLLLVRERTSRVCLVCVYQMCVSACLCVDGIEALIGSLQYSKR